MTVIGLDDTDSREGMCTTYVAARVADRLRERGGTVHRQLLVRLNPAVEHKTRGNAALAVHADADADLALAVARETVAELADVDDPDTNPAVVVADHVPGAAPRPIVEWAREAVRDHHDREAALELVDELGYGHAGWGNARGTIGALAAVGAWAAWLPPRAASGPSGPRAALDEWTCELISYRERECWGTPRRVDAESVFEAADRAHPVVWDTVDRESGEAVCVPNTPCPILHGVRGDDPEAVRAVAAAIGGEPIESRTLFLTNQGTDAHLQDGPLAAVEDGRAYRVDGVVAVPPETRPGGHVHLTLRDGDATLPCVAFEPTKRFRERVRRLRRGDRLTACGEVDDGALKLEKFAVRSLVGTERVVPGCPACGRSMKSTGRGQGYRCRDCGTTASGKAEVTVERDLEPGWYEVPPAARRHVAKPLVRGGFDGPVHPER